MIDEKNIKYDKITSEEILFDVTVILKDGTKEVYDAVSINNFSIKCGRKQKDKIIFYTYINCLNIKKIYNDYKKIIFDN
jgi:hypothetical protein